MAASYLQFPITDHRQIITTLRRTSEISKIKKWFIILALNLSRGLIQKKVTKEKY